MHPDRDLERPESTRRSLPDLAERSRASWRAIWAARSTGRTTRARGAAGSGERIARGVYAVAIVACAPLAALHLAALLAAVDARSAVPIAVGLALGVLVADLVTGLVHWSCDTWGDEQTRWIGASLIRSFHEHHRAPRAMLAHDWIDVNGQPAAAASLAFAAMALPPLAGILAAHPALHAGLVSLGAVGALANQLHQWAHAPSPPPLVRGLQRAGWILSPERHDRHHRAPHTSDYCITSGWLNRPLDATGFWRALERGVARISGARPRAGSTGRGGLGPRLANVPLARSHSPERR